ncbi:hypothetical protein [Allobranchiibius sp. GilTou38]|uniref:hypothetical protein n=1 Tax=Allobranchiibius sp. GilTou38 TaxID=2815210 RepID=UPI001AA1BF68|nr:hypothetical protein [Allobranchiibius sp. GilTou38]MBO1766995.1 hypothetical protein [Allobranchiibius sp. GilTou38]
MRGQNIRGIAALLAIVVLLAAAVSAIRYRHAYGTFNVVVRPVHLYIGGYRFEPVDQVDLPPQELVRFRPGAPHLHSVGTWSLLPVVGGRSKDVITPDTGKCIALAAIELGHNHRAFYAMEDIANNPACGA